MRVSRTFDYAEVHATASEVQLLQRTRLRTLVASVAFVHRYSLLCGGLSQEQPLSLGLILQLSVVF